MPPTKQNETKVALVVLQSDRNSGFFIFSKISLFLLLWNMFPWMPIKRLVAFSENERVEERKEKVKERARERERQNQIQFGFTRYAEIKAEAI